MIGEVDQEAGDVAFVGRKEGEVALVQYLGVLPEVGNVGVDGVLAEAALGVEVHGVFGDELDVGGGGVHTL